jgi:hypothetical protein
MANGYVGFYRNKRAECQADSKYAAQVKLARLLKARKSYDVAVELAEIDGAQVTHTPTN